MELISKKEKISKKKVYEICLHFSQENYTLTLTYGDIEEVGNELIPSAYEKISNISEKSNRKIRLEDGWVT